MRHRTLDDAVRDARRRYPDPGTTPIEHLRHTVAVFADQPDDAVAVRATASIYPPDETIGTGMRRGETGLTHGDLRAILAAPDAPAPQPEPGA